MEDHEGCFGHRLTMLGIDRLWLDELDREDPWDNCARFRGVGRAKTIAISAGEEVRTIEEVYNHILSR